MNKREQLIEQLKPIVQDSKKIELFIINNSNLPGPRANLELAFALAEVYENIDVLKKWIKITDNIAGVNDPKSFLPFCSVVCLGKLYTKKKNDEIIDILKRLSKDSRWRIREAVAFGFQQIGENDFSNLKVIFTDWIKEANNLERRAILVSLAHPKILDSKTALYCFEMLEKTFLTFDKFIDFDVLKKGLDFVISVYTIANPEKGFNFMKKWIGKEKVIDSVIVSNLKKNRLIKTFPNEVKKLLDYLNIK